MAIVKVDPDFLKGKADTLNSRIAELEALNKRLQQLISRIQASWEGSAADAYIAMMTRYLEQAKTMISILTEFRSYAQTAAEQFQSEDQSAANRINGSW